jgi:hypothetical protein
VEQLINGALEEAKPPVEGGGIVLGHDGHFALAFNREAQEMCRGYITKDGWGAVAAGRGSKLGPPERLIPPK